MGKFIQDSEIIGKTFGRLTVTSFSHYGTNSQRYFICECTCGKTKPIRLSYLRSPKAQSCGCYRIAAAVKARTTHGLYKIPEYSVFLAIKQRCNNSNCKAYKNYGGRGIRCHWQSFEDFFRDMGRRPTAKHSIERINNNGHYCKNNCKWATKIEQCNNMRKNKKFTYQGKTQTLVAWSRELGISFPLLNGRVNTLGWPFIKAITTPSAKKHKSHD